ncbi:hypothetical protein GCM10025787_08680 [Saccharopolyspora rosea]|uniref:LCP family protein n=1 Tax=Saccharopolyspora rosea TaxID=524884 RepID=A0ABW3FVG6_9PSEU
MWRILRRGVLVLVVVVVIVLVVVGVFVHRKLDEVSSAMATSRALDGAPRSTGGGTNVLLMGLDTRKDRNGRQLPPQILDKLHAGDGDEGGYNTNTLILVHVPADGGPVRGFSIPRDDAVPVPGQGVRKIKEAYGLAKADAETELARQGVTDRAVLESHGREAGRRATLEVVRSLTGVPVDHFAEVSLAGFYDIAETLGGVRVCLNHPVHDEEYSGAVFPAGPQTLDGAQSLAFVRQRHGLPNGDLDRTRRQQAFLASAAREIRDPRTLLDLTRVRNLADAAERDVVLDAGWDGLALGDQLRRMTAEGTRFDTLPIEGYATLDGQDVNVVDTQRIRALVRTAFAGGATPGGAVPVHPQSAAPGPPAEDCVD